MNRDYLLSKISDYDILNRYLAPYHKYDRLRKGKLISNPLILPCIQKTPSFNIYPTKSGWRYKDFATGHYGDCFNLVMELYSLSFPEALKLIASDFGIHES